MALALLLEAGRAGPPLPAEGSFLFLPRSSKHLNIIPLRRIALKRLHRLQYPVDGRLRRQVYLC